MSENRYQSYGNAPTQSDSIFSSLLFKTFAFFGIELILTALLTFGFSYLFNTVFPIAGNPVVYLTMAIISSIGIIVCSIVISTKAMMSGKGGLITSFLYVFFMSFLLSSFTYYVPKEILGSAVLITSGLFFIMAIFGLLIKKRIGWLIGLSIGLIVSVGIIYLVNTFLLFPILFGNTGLVDEYVTGIYVGEVILLIYACVITIIDVFKIKKASQMGQTNNTLALYFSVSLYSDFILILLKVISVLLRNRSNN